MRLFFSHSLLYYIGFIPILLNFDRINRIHCRVLRASNIEFSISEYIEVHRSDFSQCTNLGKILFLQNEDVLVILQRKVFKTSVYFYFLLNFSLIDKIHRP